MVTGFTVPNEPDAISPDQSEPDSVDFRIIAASLGRTGVVKGYASECQVTWSSGMTFNVGVGDVIAAGDRHSILGVTPITLSDGHSTLPRFDLIVVDIDGVVHAHEGTPATNRVFPVPDEGDVVLAAIDVPAGATSLAANRIVDKRLLIAFDLVVGRIGSLTVLGHSYSAGSTQVDSGTSNPWQESAIARLQSLMGIQEQNVLHLGIAGANMMGAVKKFAGWRGVLQFVLPSNSEVVNAATDVVTAGDVTAVGGASIIIYGVSDMFASLRGVDPDDETVALMNRRSAKHAYRTTLSRLRAGVVYCSRSVAGAITWPSVVAAQAGTSGIVFTGTWADAAGVEGNSGAALKNSSALGDSFTITLPQNFVGGVVAVCLIAPGAFVTHLNGAMNNSQTTITVFNRREAATSGTIVLRVDDEEMLATLDGDLTWNVTRGVNGTTPAAHSDLAVVTSSLPSEPSHLNTHRIAWTGTATGGVKSDSGTANAAVNTTNGTPGTLQDTRKSWAVNEWVGYRVFCNGKWMIVASNTADTLTGTTAWVNGDPGQDQAWTLAKTTAIGSQGNAQSVFAPSTGIIPVSVIERFFCTAADAGKTIIGTYENEVSGDTTAGVSFDSWWIEAAQPPPCVLTNVHDWGFSRNFQPNTISQPYIDDFNTMLEDVVAEFDDWVRIADVHALYWRRNGVLGSALANEATSTGVLFIANSPLFTPTVGQIMVAGGFFQTGPTTQESMLITAVAGSYPNWTLSLTRGVNGTTIRTHGDSGTANAAVSTTNGTPGTLTDTREAWTVNQWAGHVVVCNGKRMVIASNTATVLTGRTAWIGGDPGQAQSWVIGEWMGPTDWMALDLLHINNKGHAVYAEAIFREFAAMPTPAPTQLAQIQGNWSQYSQMWAMGVVDDQYLYVPCTAMTQGTMVEDQQVAMPIWIARTCVLTEIGLNTVIGGGGGADSVVRFGIYMSDPSRARPGKLLQDLGTAVATGSGVDVIKTGCYQVLRPGWYWLSCCAQDTSAGTPTQPTVRTINAGGLPYPSLMTPTTLGAALSPMGYKQTITPDAQFADWVTYTPTSVATEVPRMFIKLRTTQFG